MGNAAALPMSLEMVSVYIMAITINVWLLKWTNKCADVIYGRYYSNSAMYAH